jgi:hypothetical protein
MLVVSVEIYYEFVEIEHVWNVLCAFGCELVGSFMDCSILFDFTITPVTQLLSRSGYQECVRVAGRSAHRDAGE